MRLKTLYSYFCSVILLFLLFSCSVIHDDSTGAISPTDSIILPPVGVKGGSTPTYTITGTPTPTNTPSPTFTETLSPTNSPGLSPTKIEGITATSIIYHIPGTPFGDYKCGIAFDFPLHWKIYYTDNIFTPDSICDYGLKPDTFQAIQTQSTYCMGEYALYVEGVNMGLEDAAAVAGFKYEDGSWYILGRQMSKEPAEMINTRGLFILRGTADVGYFDKSCDGPVRWGFSDRALVSDGINRSVILSEDSPEFQLHFEYILQTISFVPQ